MLANALALALTLGGVVVIVTMLLRFQHLPTLARSAIVASAFGLFTASRYVEANHRPVAAIFAIGVAGIMAVTAVRHFRAFPPDS